MRYITLLILLLTPCCAKNFCPEVPRPTYPIMKRVVMNPDGSIGPINAQAVRDNMLYLSEYIDELCIAPCYKEKAP